MFTSINLSIVMRRMRSFDSTPIALILASFAVIAALAISARAWLLPAPPIAASANSTASRSKTLSPPSGQPAAVQGNKSSGQVEVEVVKLRPIGFEPKEITLPAGRFLLAIDNNSGLDDLVLQLNREAGASLHEQHTSRKKPHWRKVIDFTPGRYVLIEASHPDWVCHITITAH